MMGIRAGRKPRHLLYTYKHTFITKRRQLVLIFVTGNMVIAGVYHYLLPTYSVFPLASTSVSCGSLPAGMTQTFVLSSSI